MLDLVFEYVLPQHNPSSNRFVNENHIRADIILVSAKSALVLEFKQRSDDFIGLFHQAKKYKNRLQDYHIASEDLEVESLLVLTKAKNYWDDCDGVTGCSPDWLCDVIPDLLGDEPEKHPNILQWLDSAFLNYEMPVKEEPPYLPILLHVADQLEAIDNRLKRLEEKKAQIKKTINKD